MTVEERICGEDGAPMRDAGIYNQMVLGCLFVLGILGMFYMFL